MRDCFLRSITMGVSCKFHQLITFKSAFLKDVSLHYAISSVPRISSPRHLSGHSLRKVKDLSYSSLFGSLCVFLYFPRTLPTPARIQRYASAIGGRRAAPSSHSTGSAPPILIVGRHSTSVTPSPAIFKISGRLSSGIFV